MTTRKHALYGILALVSLLGLGITQSARANLVTNGGFENGGFFPWTVSGDTSSTGVTGTGYVSPHSGMLQGYFGPLFDHEFLTQNLSTTPGTSYVLDFWLANYSDNAQPNNFFAVSWGGMTLGNSLTNASDFGYTEYMFNVTASTTTTALQFDFFNPPGYFYLDDVSVNPVGVGVPDGGSTVSLLSFALLGLTALRRKLRC